MTDEGKCKHCGASDWWFDRSYEGYVFIGDRCNKCGHPRSSTEEEKDDIPNEFKHCQMHLKLNCSLCRYTEKIKSLESRLSEMEKRAFEYHAEWESACLRERGRIEDVKDLESRLTKSQKDASSCDKLQKKLSQAEKELAAVATEEWDALKDRLSQAEDERDRAAQMAQEMTPTWMHERVVAGNKDLKARLSHLMDVGGKMALVIDKLLHPWCMVSHGHMPSDSEKAKQALAEWDGIK